jgi:hypothetical protein
MVTYYLIHTVTRKVLYETNDSTLLSLYIDEEIAVDMIPRVSVIVDQSTD